MTSVSERMRNCGHVDGCWNVSSDSFGAVLETFGILRKFCLIHSVDIASSPAGSFERQRENTRPHTLGQSFPPKVSVG